MLGLTVQHSPDLTTLPASPDLEEKTHFGPRNRTFRKSHKPGQNSPGWEHTTLSIPRRIAAALFQPSVAPGQGTAFRKQEDLSVKGDKQLSFCQPSSLNTVNIPTNKQTETTGQGAGGGNIQVAALEFYDKSKINKQRT